MFGSYKYYTYICYVITNLKLKIMIKLNIEGIRAKQYRLFHSKKFRGFNFIKLRNRLKSKGDLAAQNELITEYLVEDNEMDYTSYTVFMITAITLMVMLVIIMLVNPITLLIHVGLLFSSFVCFLVSRKKKTNFVLGEVGIDMSESYFEHKIKEKFNL